MDPATDTTPATTVVPSQAHSIAPNEKEVDASSANSSRAEEPNTKPEAVSAGLEEAAAPDQPSDELVYPKGFTLATVLVALCLAVFLVALDNTIIATAIPRITDQFKALDDVGWYASAYLLTTCSFQLLFGKFYTFFSIKWVFLFAIGIFELGSLICGVAPNSTALIVGRAIAGLGSAGIFSGALIIIAYSVPLVKRPIYTGLVGGMYGIASVAGPLMGGAFTDHATWRWCFYINLPLGAVAFVIIAIFFKSPQRTKEASIGFSERLKQFDIVGTIVFVPAIVCLLLALQWGGTEYPWSDGRIIALFVVFALLIIVFVAVQFRNDERVTVPIRIASQRSVAASALFGMLLSGSFFLFIFYLPIWFQAIKGTTATESGIHNLPLILAQVFASIASGVAISKIGYYTPFMYASTVFAALGSGLITTFAVDTPTSRWIGYQIIYGLGSGMGFQQPMMAAQTVLPLDDVPIGTAFVMFIQLLGGAMFVSVGENIFTNQLVRNVVATVPTLDPQVVLQTGATALRGIVDADRLPALLAAYNDALTKTYQVALILASLSAVFAALMEWRSVKGKQVEKDG